MFCWLSDQLLLLPTALADVLVHRYIYFAFSHLGARVKGSKAQSEQSPLHPPSRKERTPGRKKHMVFGFRSDMIIVIDFVMFCFLNVIRYQMGQEEFLVLYNWYCTLNIAIPQRSRENLSWTLTHETQDYGSTIPIKCHKTVSFLVFFPILFSCTRIWEGEMYFLQGKNRQMCQEVVCHLWKLKLLIICYVLKFTLSIHCLIKGSSVGG